MDLEDETLTMVFSSGSLEEVHKLAQFANENLVSIGSSLEHVHVPGRGVPEDFIPNGEVEIGMGIHNEPGSHRTKADLNETVSTMLKQLLDPNDTDRAFVKHIPEDDFVLLINNLGGVSPIELAGITDEVHRQLVRDHKVKPVRVIQGTFLTSLNGMGFSISLLKLADNGLGEGKSMLDLIDAPAEAVGWSAPIDSSTWNERIDTPVELEASNVIEDAPSNLKRKLYSQTCPLYNLSLRLTPIAVDPSIMKKVLSAGLKRVIAAEPDVTRFDTIVGDGDCGIGLKRGAEAIQKLLDSTPPPLTDDAVNTVLRIVDVVENVMDGTSGAIYAIFLNALAHGLRDQDTGSNLPVTSEVWAKALKHSVTALAKYTPAKPGDRTMIDALVPFCDTLLETQDVRVAAAAAQQGTESTKSMKASLGRSVYVGGQEEWIGKVPDPGAYGLSEFLTGLAEAV